MVRYISIPHGFFNINKTMSQEQVFDVCQNRNPNRVLDPPENKEIVSPPEG